MSELSVGAPEDPVTLLNCDGAAFGASILLEMDGPDTLTPNAKAAIQALRTNMDTLLTSPHEVHKTAVERINRTFRINDQLEFNKALTDRNRVGEHHVLDWLAGSNDATFLELARWNVERRRALALQLEEDHDELVEGALQKTIDLINLDFFPADALRRVRLAAKTYAPFRAMDSFEAGAMGASGYFNDEAITLGNLYALATEQFGISPHLQETTLHELFHGSGEVSGGGFFLDPSAPIYARALEEAFVTHGVTVAHSGRDDPQVAVYDPSERIGKTSLIYSQERQMLELLSSSELADIPPDLWAAGFFSDTKSKYNNEIASRLKRAFASIRQSPTAFADFNKAYERTWDTQDRAARSRLLTDLEVGAAALRGEQLVLLSEDETPAENVQSWVIKIPA